MSLDNDAHAGSSRTQSYPSAPRVSQVDADELDEGLVSMLGEKVGQALGNFKSSWSHDLKPEVALVLKLVIFRYGVLDPTIRASPGAKLQNLKLVSGRHTSPPSLRKRILLYLLLHPPIFPTYVLTRLRQHALSSQWPDLPAHDWRRNAWRAIVRAENAARAWELLGWGWFLWDGQYPSLLMRILGLRLVPSSPHLTRLVSYEFMNRQLVWGAFTEFLMFSVPLLPPIPAYLTPSALLAPLKSFLSQPTSIDYNSLPALPSQHQSGTSTSPAGPVHTGPLAHLPKSTCPICYLRTTSAPVPLVSGGSGPQISLPPIHGTEWGSQSHTADLEHGDIAQEEETRIFVPAQSNCRGGCRWCYYCIAEELVKQSEMESGRKAGARKRKGNGKEGGKNGGEEEGWTCLRCGGVVSRAWRVGAEEEDMAGQQDVQDGVESP
ncbi:peroxisome assembly protein (Peroxin-2) [Saitozyma podzolica]|uniref:Peroxisome assembly protein (Peroxin-2) n=1 Tax=Saitozyma podzolica TaxID=1890683 RepID=A0A427Y8G8_9TREE|nr:peroxisome assembly protein (Peroxin-2) [Saitozyma podzolica]